MSISAIKQRLLKKSLSKKRRGKIDIIPEHLKTHSARLAIVRKVVHSDKTQEERKQQSIAITKRVKKDVWNWNKPTAEAAYLVAEGRMSFKDIEERTGISAHRLKIMMQNEGEFSKRVAIYREEWMTRLKHTSIANRDMRINILAEMADKLVSIYRDRSKHYKNRKYPGVNSGMMVRTIKAVGHGPTAKFVRGWETDTALARELRETMQQMAKERGEWTEKTENLNTVLVREYGGVNPADV